MATFRGAEELKSALEELSQVGSVGDFSVEGNFIRTIAIETESAGRMIVRRLEVDDAAGLFEFYSEGLSEKPRKLFAPYPLFHTPPGSTRELSRRIADWKKENDWTALNLIKEGRIIGFGLLKRFKTEKVTSSIVIRDEFLKKGLGYLLQNIIIEQARLLNLKRFHVKVVSDNLASMRLHEKCGFTQTRILPSNLYQEMFKYLSDRDQKNGNKAVDRKLVEMVIELEPVESDKFPGIKGSAGKKGSKVTKKNVSRY
jgi:RimJ/RimL family protein N-acetyltransferase